ncbi:MAG: hypothetical protein FJ098_05980 [Deltaproteobacteria bacterium]|nr:hypothetical protein [Deltaproteobacteria bacterium]
MRKLTTVVALLTLLSAPLRAEEGPPALPLRDAPEAAPAPAPETPPPFGALEKVAGEGPQRPWPTGKDHPLGFWGRFMDAELDKIGEMDLYGVTSQLPKGYAYIKWDWGMIEAGSRFNNRRQRGPVMAPIEFSDDTDGDGVSEKLISIDMGLEGKGGGHTFQFSYGIIDPLDWYIEVPFTYMKVRFKPKTNIIDEDGNRIAPSLAGFFGVDDPKTFSAAQFNDQILPMLGRPSLDTTYTGRWLLGDINTGVSWNIFRNSRFSVALTPRVYLPTGHTPAADSNILWGTGPELETGIGGWATGFTQGYDLRIYKYSYWIDIILSAEFTVGYGFPQKRKYPTNFVPPNPLAVALDPLAFPDLSHLKGTFSYTPGFSVDFALKLGVQVAILGLAAGIGVSHSQEPELVADRSFIQMAKSLELLGQMQQEAFQLAASINLLPFYVPMEMGFSWTKVISGYNAIVFDNFFQFTVKTYFPIWRDWSSGRTDS